MKKSEKLQSMAIKKKTVVLLDAHAILHRAYHALPDFRTSKGEPTGGLFGLISLLLKIVSEFNPEHIIACFDLPSPTFRKELFPDYKAGRKKTDDDLIEQIIKSRDVLDALAIPYFEKPGFEADDLLGTIATILKKESGLRTIIASGDMDTLALVDGKTVVVYTLRKGIQDTVVYDEDAVNARFGFGPRFMADYKSLRGDPSDNIIGVAGIGEKIAKDLIIKFGSIEKIYYALEKNEAELLNKGVKQRTINLLKEHKEEAFFSKILAEIKTDVEIDFKLPDFVWRESVDLDRAAKMFDRFEFKSLKSRFLRIFSGEINPPKEQAVSLQSDTSPEIFKKAAIALWLLDSNITSPTREDILSLTGAVNIEEAIPRLEKEIKENGLEKVFYDIELPLIPIIERAESRGILVDTNYLTQLSKDYHQKLSVVRREIFDLAGIEFNINSPKQLSEILFEKLGLSKVGIKKTSGGAVSTKESELEKLEEAHPIIKRIIVQRGLQKLLSTYIDNIPLMVDQEHRLHTNLNQTGTTTGRMSSDSPNLQNIPIKSEEGMAVRRAFIAEDGFFLAAFDYSQIEMRILAELSGDEILRTAFRNGEDVHASVAALVFGVPQSEVTKEMRRRAKVINFGIIYGMGVRALKKNLNSSLGEAEEFYRNYFDKLPGVRNFFEIVKKGARENGFTTTLFGRRRYFSDINSAIPYVRSTAERMAMNAPLQGTATADIIKMSMTAVNSALEKKGLSGGVFLLLQIHDELLYEIKDSADFESTIKLIKKEMENVVALSVPLVVNVKTGKNWADIV